MNNPKSLTFLIKPKKNSICPPSSKGGREYVKTIGVALDWSAEWGSFKITPINSRGSLTRIINLRLDSNVETLRELELAFRLLREFKEEYDMVREDSAAVEKLCSEFQDKWYKRQTHSDL